MEWFRALLECITCVGCTGRAGGRMRLGLDMRLGCMGLFLQPSSSSAVAAACSSGAAGASPLTRHAKQPPLLNRARPDSEANSDAIEIYVSEVSQRLLPAGISCGPMLACSRPLHAHAAAHLACPTLLLNPPNQILSGMLEVDELVTEAKVEALLSCLVSPAVDESPAAADLARAVLRRREREVQPVLQRLLTRLLTSPLTANSGLWEQSYALVAALHEVTPQALLPVVPLLTDELRAAKAEKRLEAVRLLGRLFGQRGGAAVAKEWEDVLIEFLCRFRDSSAEVRLAMLDLAPQLVGSMPSDEACAKLLLELNLRLRDPDEKVSGRDGRAALAAAAAVAPSLEHFLLSAQHPHRQPTRAAPSLLLPPKKRSASQPARRSSRSRRRAPTSSPTPRPPPPRACPQLRRSASACATRRRPCAAPPPRRRSRSSARARWPAAPMQPAARGSSGSPRARLSASAAITRCASN